MALILQEGASLQAGDIDGDDNLKYQNLESAQLPDLEEMNETHHGGGTVGEVAWGNLGIKALEPSFKLKGHDPQVMGLFGKQFRSPWTFRGILRNKQTQIAVGVRCVVMARLGKISPEAFERGKLMGHDHSLHEVVVYRLYYDGNEKIYWDHFANIYRVNGVPVNADEIRLLALPGA